ncbi:rhomboid family intramembrane serine protease [Halomicroarcula sp. GCM10025817]|uniref:rhomboid family intramembrane serine protease n=1 Tax=Haloarcula TaxID=2237 RepID=UPI0023E7F802|nr:rhomboid family intramembrane serine protease [Halomicroarcula sp. SYNS111]
MIQATPELPGVLTGLPLRAAAVVLVVLATGLGLRRVTGARVPDVVRTRLLLGVPWGTLLTMGALVAVYLFLQGTWWHPRPLVTPFRTWSYFYPLGILTSAFTHSGQSHITGNLLGTLVYGAVVEYAWGHYPRRRGVQTFTSLRTNPFARVLAIPLAAFVVGLFTALFAIGPVVGFSGVVFALAGFALVTRPVLFLGALLAGRIVDLFVRALRFPEFTARARQQFVTPWWADVAIQGHAIGMLAGVVLAVWMLRRRESQPNVPRVFFAALVFAVFQGLWAIYVPLGGGRFTLFRWVGTAGVFLLALLVAVAVADVDQPLEVGFERPSASLATLALLVVLGALAFAAVPASVVTIGPEEVPDDGVTVRDYVVTYDENVRNEYAAGIWTPVETDRTIVNESGVIVASDARETWLPVVQKGQLALNGRATVVVGGIGWREQVVANRTGWVVLGNDTVYRVTLRRAGGEPKPVFESPPSTPPTTVAGRNVTVQAAEDGFVLEVWRGNQTLGVGRVPANMTTADVGGLTFERNRTRLFVARNDTRVQIARYQTDQRER